MSRRILSAAALLMLSLTPAFVRAVHAQEPVTNVQLDMVPVVARALAAPAPALAAAVAPAGPSFRSAPAMQYGRHSAVLLSLYATTAAMQMMDVRSSLAAFNSGAVEANSLMSGIVKSTPMFIAFKAGVAASAIYSAHAMAKHNKIGAIIMLSAVNSAYAMVVSHNFALAATRR